MSIFGRLFKIGEANANNVLDKFEKPELMLEQAVRDQEKNIREARQKVQFVIATERQTKALLDEEKDNTIAWQSKAEAALRAGNEELATKALVRSEEHTSKSTSLQPQWEIQRTEVEKLKVAIGKMENELSELRRNKDLIIAQSKMAEVKKTIYEAKAQIGNKSGQTQALIERMKAKAVRATYEADAAEELAEVTGGDDLEKEFAKLGTTTTASPSVQDKLAALKAKINN